ncbi:cytochrome c4 [Thiomicrospira microaerophila]|uniref:c-type cytochrome n=1 Tax=Thiomicrospira microaerophila TaxID=406020 RepID=UPI00200F82CB|nr:c-type cytochrome [Thiomicrospira microaerophila]UQB42349.1 cytochrome c4 [Thiomicrospira microaerophila]
MINTKKPFLKKWMGVVLAGGLMASGMAQAEFDRSTMLANTCVGCHGINGISDGPAIPSIGGMSEEYFINSMKEFRAGERPNTIMTRLAKGYTDQDIEDMAKYFAKQKYVQVEQAHDRQAAQLGQRLHNTFCDRCHDAAGTNPEDEAGFLSGQMRAYLEYSLQDYLSGEREYKESRMKRELESLINRHGDAGVQQLLDYYASGKE